MRIAIPLADEAGTLAEKFSATGHFALYDVHDETRAVAYLGRKQHDQPGCGGNAGFLREQGVEVVLAHGVSDNAVKHLLAAGIVAIQDAPLLTSDALIAHLVSGTLQARSPQMQGGCGGGGCGHCGTHAHAEEATHECAEQTAEQGCCGGHSQAAERASGHGCCGGHGEAAEQVSSHGCCGGGQAKTSHHAGGGCCGGHGATDSVTDTAAAH